MSSIAEGIKPWAVRSDRHLMQEPLDWDAEEISGRECGVGIAALRACVLPWRIDDDALKAVFGASCTGKAYSTRLEYILKPFWVQGLIMVLQRSLLWS